MSSKFSRLDFLRTSALGAVAMTFPSLSSAAEATKKAKKTDANDFVNLAFIGLGQQNVYLKNEFIKLPDVRVVAACDVYDIKRNRFEQQVNKYYAEKGIKQKIDMYIDFEEVLARPDIDAVVSLLQTISMLALLSQLVRQVRMCIWRSHLHLQYMRVSAWWRLFVPIIVFSRQVLCSVHGMSLCMLPM